MDKLPENKREATLAREKERNDKTKQMARMIGQNLSLYVCLMLPVLLIGLIWTDSSLPKFGWGLLSDGIITVLMFVIGERAMLQIGTTSGKLDDEYFHERSVYKALVERVKGIGTLLLDPYCDWQTDVELEQARRIRCRRLRVDYKEYLEKYSNKSLDELKQILRPDLALKIHAINALEPIDLTAEILLTDGLNKYGRGGVPVGGDEYVEQKKFGRKGLIISVLTAVFTVGISLTMTKDITLARVIYTFLKLTALLFRMASGYTNGVKAYNTVEVRHLQAKIRYLQAYVEFIEKKIYRSIAERYEQIRDILKLEECDKSAASEELCETKRET
ncbi:MAG: hypothetical protein E7589_01240 [Ruminococcaceae bacterium]|nr:hypothetical protein [Oscillospiraceae bacterium]